MEKSLRAGVYILEVETRSDYMRDVASVCLTLRASSYITY